MSLELDTWHKMSLIYFCLPSYFNELTAQKRFSSLLYILCFFIHYSEIFDVNKMSEIQ